MKKSILKLAAFSLLAVAIAVAPTQAFSQAADKPATGSEDAAKPKRDTVPFRGKIASIDKDAKTITIGERTFQVTSDTKIVKAGKPATLDDAVVGDEVGGVSRKSEDGKLTVVSLRLGAKPEAPEKPTK